MRLHDGDLYPGSLDFIDQIASLGEALRAERHKSKSAPEFSLRRKQRLHQPQCVMKKLRKKIVPIGRIVKDFDDVK